MYAAQRDVRRVVEVVYPNPNEPLKFSPAPDKPPEIELSRGLLAVLKNTVPSDRFNILLNTYESGSNGTSKFPLELSPAPYTIVREPGAGVGVLVGVGVCVNVGVGVKVGAPVDVGVGVGVKTMVGVGVGVGHMPEATVGTGLTPPAANTHPVEGTA